MHDVYFQKPQLDKIVDFIEGAESGGVVSNLETFKDTNDIWQNNTEELVAHPRVIMQFDMRGQSYSFEYTKVPEVKRIEGKHGKFIYEPLETFRYLVEFYRFNEASDDYEPVNLTDLMNTEE